MRKFALLVLIACMSLWLFAAVCQTAEAQTPAAAQQEPPPPPLHAKAPKILHKVQPTYPAEAKATGVQGEVVLHVVVDKNGQPEDVRVMSGDPLLTQAAADAVRQWRWEPTVVKGKPVTVSTKITVNFRLDK